MIYFVLCLMGGMWLIAWLIWFVRVTLDWWEDKRNGLLD